MVAGVHALCGMARGPWRLGRQQRGHGLGREQQLAARRSMQPGFPGAVHGTWAGWEGGCSVCLVHAAASPPARSGGARCRTWQPIMPPRLPPHRIMPPIIMGHAAAGITAARRAHSASRVAATARLMVGSRALDVLLAYGSGKCRKQGLAVGCTSLLSTYHAQRALAAPVWWLRAGVAPKPSISMMSASLAVHSGSTNDFQAQKPSITHCSHLQAAPLGHRASPALETHAALGGSSKL